MNPHQIIRAVRALETKIEALEAQVAFLTNVSAPKEKRPYNRKTPNAVTALEPVCQNSPMEN